MFASSSLFSPSWLCRPSPLAARCSRIIAIVGKGPLLAGASHCADLDQPNWVNAMLVLPSMVMVPDPAETIESEMSRK
jgi:hypothetical protein